MWANRGGVWVLLGYRRPAIYEDMYKRMQTLETAFRGETTSTLREREVWASAAADV